MPGLSPRRRGRNSGTLLSPDGPRGNIETTIKKAWEKQQLIAGAEKKEAQVQAGEHGIIGSIQYAAEQRECVHKVGGIPLRLCARGELSPCHLQLLGTSDIEYPFRYHLQLLGTSDIE